LGVKKEDRDINKDFILNNEPYNKSKILLTRDNFGCGSSREHAVWALRDFGIKAVIASSFGDIFYNNCFKNGVLPIKLEKDDIEKFFNLVKIEVVEISIDLQQRSIFLSDKIQISFKVDDHLIDRIIFSLDDVDISLKEEDKIMLFEKNRKISKPWIYANE
jgi:3-isopropylmalate/(R)-2-methylmalate dehydratase small subunit